MLSGDCDIINSFAIQNEHEQSILDTGFDYPLGLFDFTAECSSPGQSVDVKIFYDKNYDTTKWKFRKLLNNNYANLENVTIGNQTINGSLVSTISYSITDGGANDNDSTSNSTIKDPAGPAIESTIVSNFSDNISNANLLTSTKKLINTGEKVLKIYISIGIFLVICAIILKLTVLNNTQASK